MNTEREHPVPVPADPGHQDDLFGGWTLPDGTFEGFPEPLTREELVQRFVERCSATTS
ncbi:hypothetical protein [Kineococcus arenarius]|uniref:hypothetical protein n=1 Tax=Kineococcus sp. SYSU DK007 TaxID=3383128 RepID=UPI003D7DA716